MKLMTDRLGCSSHIIPRTCSAAAAAAAGERAAFPHCQSATAARHQLFQAAAHDGPHDGPGRCDSHLRHHQQHRPLLATWPRLLCCTLRAGGSKWVPAAAHGSSVCMLRITRTLILQNSLSGACGEPLEQWDLHVGAQLSLLGQTVVLKRVNLRHMPHMICVRTLLCWQLGCVSTLLLFTCPGSCRTSHHR